MIAFSNVSPFKSGYIFVCLFRAAVAVMVLIILAIIWIIKTRQEKSESILNLSKSKDQMNKAQQMENETSFITKVH